MMPNKGRIESIGNLIASFNNTLPDSISQGALFDNAYLTNEIARELDIDYVYIFYDLLLPGILYVRREKKIEVYAFNIKAKAQSEINLRLLEE